MMERVAIAPGLSFSRLVYGMWRLGDDPDTSPAHVQAKAEACLEQGITTMDQADIYGGYMAEEILGDALRAAPHLKDRIEIAPGLNFSRIVYGMWRLGDDPDTSPAHVQAKVEACLEQGITTMD